MLFFCVLTVGMFTVGIRTVGMFTVGMVTVGIFTVGLVLFVLKGATPLLHRGCDVCPLFGAYLSIDF